MLMMKFIKSLILLGVMLVFVGVVGLGFVTIVSGGNPLQWVRTEMLRVSLAQRQDELQRGAGTDPTEKMLTIESGDTPGVIASQLYERDLISDAQLFVDYVRVKGLDIQLEAGTYFLNQTQPIPEIARILIDSSNSFIRFRVLPGSRIEEIADLVDATPRFQFTGDTFLSLVDSGAQIDPTFAETYGIPVGTSLEGFLFPDTYILSPNTTAESLRDELLTRFEESVGTQLVQDAARQGLTIREAVTVASIIEREAVWEDEHPLISSVYRNRLDIGMKLDADPTIQYALDGTRGRWWPNITQADYRSVQSPYNTYLAQGLPPGPIANPSLTAIRSAVYPAESNYLYFRARCDGSNYHAFATTYDEHLANGC